ncbi:MAG: serine/threonine protein kinase [Cyanobacteria bacterium HKST-UBA02]|nr:serine/threonine protein kinase [Cyanobacteria bacterium HKST-UBA02]
MSDKETSKLDRKEEALAEKENFGPTLRVHEESKQPDLPTPAVSEPEDSELKQNEIEEKQNETAGDQKGQDGKENLIKRLPRIGHWQLVTIALFWAPWPMLAVGFCYWLFASSRLINLARERAGLRLVRTAHFLIMSIAPIAYVALYMYEIIRLPSSHAMSFCNLILVIGWGLYQLAWPFLTGLKLEEAIAQKEGKESRMRLRWLVPAFYALSMNLFVLYWVYMAALYRVILNRHIIDTAIAEIILNLVMTCGFLLIQFLCLRYFSDRLRALCEHRKIKKEASQYTIRYRAFAGLERWLAHRFKERSNKKLFYLLFVIMLFFALGAPQWGLSILANLARVGAIVGGSGGGEQGAANLQFLWVFQWSILLSVVAGWTAYLFRPTHLDLSEKGVHFLWHHKIFNFDQKELPWQSINRISIEMPKGKTSPSDQILVLHTDVGQNFKIKLGSISDVLDRERILKAIERWAPGVHRDVSVLTALEAPADHSYTELWLKALSAPPKRERFKPLSKGAKLKEGRFEMIDQLGVGGQGTAYRVRDSEGDEDVVLKEFILPVYVDVAVRRQALERFENEARILKQLDHPQIVSLTDFFIEDHRSYLVLEHINGKSLKQLVMEKGPMSEDEVKGLALQMCTILDYLHGLSPPVVHRDFTPDNLILREDGTLKLVDFNVAQQTEATATGTVVGKHAYLPPEQFRGTPVPASDLYSMGATLHFLLTGQDPEPISISHPQKINSRVSGAMDFLVAKATAMSLDDRYGSSEEIRKDLDSKSDAEP